MEFTLTCIAGINFYGLLDKFKENMLYLKKNKNEKESKKYLREFSLPGL